MCNPESSIRENKGRDIILCIDDNRANRTLLREIFRLRENVEFLEASCAETGLDLARTCRPDLILVDIKLPGMSGLEFVREIRAQQSLSQIRTVALTGAKLIPEEDYTGPNGFDALVYKPYSIDVLMETVESQLIKVRE